MTFPIEIIAIAIVATLVLVGLVYLGLRIAEFIWRFTVTVHRKTLIREMIQFSLGVALLGMIDTTLYTRHLLLSCMALDRKRLPYNRICNHFNGHRLPVLA